MLKINSDKIWDLLKKDANIQKCLLKYIEEELKELEDAQNMVQESRRQLNHLGKKKEDLEQKRNDLDDQIVQKNGDISYLEIKKFFTEIRLKRLNSLYQKANTSKKKKKYLKLIQKEERHYQDLSKQQDEMKSDIQQIIKQQDDIKDDLKCINEQIYDQQRILSRQEDYLDDVEEKKKIKEQRFYKAMYEEVSQNFQPCQNLVVPDLEEKRKMTKSEAKKKANPILIDQEFLLQDPNQLKVRRLTREEKEKYQSEN